jgi:hypothetical protein
MFPFRTVDQRIADLEATVESRDRTIRVLTAETEAMAGVIARDRARVAAETAIACRTRAESEGTHERRNQ